MMGGGGTCHHSRPSGSNPGPSRYLIQPFQIAQPKPEAGRRCKRDLFSSVFSLQGSAKCPSVLVCAKSEASQFSSNMFL